MITRREAQHAHASVLPSNLPALNLTQEGMQPTGARTARQEGAGSRTHHTKLNLGCGQDIRPGWINADAYLQGNGIVHCDFTQTPWPWPTASFDHILMSHVLEHTPIIYEEQDNGTRRDILFHIMEEAHRTLRPDGIIEIKVPWGGTQMGFCHPQHYRQITPQWFDYFSPASPENYYSTARFRIQKWRRNRLGMRAAHFLPIRGLGLTSHLKDRLPFLAPILTRRDELELHLTRAEAGRRDPGR